jgi:hypothetical protein
MALPNKPVGELKAVRDPEVEEREVDVLIVGGGMAACGTAFEVKKWLGDDQTVLLCDKAAMESAPAPLPRACPPSTPMLAKMLPKTMSAWSATT